MSASVCLVEFNDMLHALGWDRQGIKNERGDL